MALRRASGRPRLTLHAVPSSFYLPAFGSWGTSALLLIVEGYQALPDMKPLP